MYPRSSILVVSWIVFVLALTASITLNPIYALVSNTCTLISSW